MADYFRLIARAVAELKPDAHELRRQVYERARAVLVERLNSMDPPLDDIRRTRERLALEEAFRRIEAAIEKAAEVGLTFVEFARYSHIVETLGNLAGALRQQPQGARIVCTGTGVLRFDATASPPDQAVGADHLIRRTHAQLQATIAAVAGDARRRLGPGRWVGLVRAIDTLGELIGLPVAELANRIGSMWCLTIALRAYVERSEDARRDASGADDPLDADFLHEVKNLVFAAGPWVRRFPSGRALDSDMATWAGSHGDFAAAAALLRRVEDAALVDAADGTIVSIAFDAGQGDSIPAVRARCWAVATLQNVGIVLVQALNGLAASRIGAPGVEAAAFAAAATSIQDIVLNGRHELAGLLAPLGDGIEPDVARDALLSLAS
jgi:hypothetical protein